jgi:hypothetical protein
MSIKKIIINIITFIDEKDNLKSLKVNMNLLYHMFFKGETLSDLLIIPPFLRISYIFYQFLLFINFILLLTKSFPIFRTIEYVLKS